MSECKKNWRIIALLLGIYLSVTSNTNNSHEPRATSQKLRRGKTYRLSTMECDGRLNLKIAGSKDSPTICFMYKTQAPSKNLSFFTTFPKKFYNIYERLRYAGMLLDGKTSSSSENKQLIHSQCFSNNENTKFVFNDDSRPVNGLADLGRLFDGLSPHAEVACVRASPAKDNKLNVIQMSSQGETYVVKKEAVDSQTAYVIYNIGKIMNEDTVDKRVISDDDFTSFLSQNLPRKGAKFTLYACYRSPLPVFLCNDERNFTEAIAEKIACGFVNWVSSDARISSDVKTVIQREEKALVSLVKIKHFVDETSKVCVSVGNEKTHEIEFTDGEVSENLDNLNAYKDMMKYLGIIMYDRLVNENDLDDVKRAWLTATCHLCPDHSDGADNAAVFDGLRAKDLQYGSMQVTFGG